MACPQNIFKMKSTQMCSWKTLANKFLKILYKGTQPYNIQPNRKFQINIVHGKL